MRRRWTLSAFMLVLAAMELAPLAAITPARSDASPVYVVRHAERADGGAARPPGGMAGENAMLAPADPPLSTEGQARAARLALMLREAGITRIYTTEYARTRQTAEPVARAAGVEITVVPSKDHAALVQKISAPGGPALVVGHSNTVPDILKALGIEEPIRIADSEYDNLFVVVRAGGASQVLKLKF